MLQVRLFRDRSLSTKLLGAWFLSAPLDWDGMAFRRPN
jgi:hypothetical protein